MKYILYAIPVFLVLIAIEWVAGWILKKRYYRFNDSVNDLSMGIVDQVGGAFLGALFFAAYFFLYEHFRLFDMTGYAEHGWWAILAVWGSLYILQDLAYYWAHRMSHETNIGWALHITHHQSEEYNLSVALRQSVFQPFFFYIFYYPLAFLGYPPIEFFTVATFNALYQFWIHTRAVKKLGPLEWVLNTPSHHRVHHASDEKYIDKNHAGTFIVWDRLFGTFVEEEEEPKYGIVTPLQSWNPLWGQTHYLLYLARLAWNAPRWRDKFLLWFMPPAWRPEGMELTKGGHAATYEKYDAMAPPALMGYVAIHFALLFAVAVAFLATHANLGGLERVWCAAIVIAGLTAFGGIFETRWWAPLLEVARLAAFTGGIFLFGGAFFGWPAAPETPLRIAGIALTGLSAAWLLAHRHAFIGVLTTRPVDSMEGNDTGTRDAATAG